MIRIPSQTRLFQPSLLELLTAEWFIGNVGLNRLLRRVRGSST
jgi:hypothetical protein